MEETRVNVEDDANDHVDDVAVGFLLAKNH